MNITPTQGVVQAYAELTHTPASLLLQALSTLGAER